MLDNEKLSQELRSVLSGKRKPSQSILAKCAERLAHWQQLARRYRGDGLSRSEVEKFWRELQDQRTTIDLILQISVKRGDWARASREVKAFIDELTYEMSSDDGAHQRLLEAAAAQDLDDDEFSDDIDSDESISVPPELEEGIDPELMLRAEAELVDPYKEILQTRYGLDGDFAEKLSQLLAFVQPRLDEELAKVHRGEKLEPLDVVEMTQYATAYLRLMEENMEQVTQGMQEMLGGIVDDPDKFSA